MSKFPPKSDAKHGTRASATRGPKARSRKKARDKTRTATGRRNHDDGLEWLVGFHPVREALRAQRRKFEMLWIRSGRARGESGALRELAQSAGVAVEVVDPEKFDERIEYSGNDQGIALRAGPIPELTLSALIDLAKQAPGGGSRLVALDGVEDPQNVGALARVAESAGAHGLILTARRAPDLTPAVSRASAGAIEWLPVARVSNMSSALAKLQEREYWVVAAGLGADSSIFEIEDRLLTGNLALVLGAEGKGIRRGILERADHLVEIPMRGQIASLNVSTAGAIILYEMLRRSESESRTIAANPAGRTEADRFP